MPQILGTIASHGAGARSGDFDSIQTITVGAGGVSTVEFTSIPQTYTHLQLRCFALESNVAASANITFNSDTATNYAYHSFYADGSGFGNYSGGNSASMYAVFFGTSTVGSGNIIDILDYANTNKYKTIRTLEGFDANGSGYICFSSGHWRNTNAITSIKLALPYTITQYSHFALYGIKTV